MTTKNVLAIDLGAESGRVLRVGFDEFEVSHPVLIERLERGQTGGLGLYGQPAAGGPERSGGYSWRRTR